MNPKGTVVFTTVGRPNYGFDLFTLQLEPKLGSEVQVTDGLSINFNGQFLDDNHSFVFTSERTGSSRIYIARPGLPKPETLPFIPESLFHDRPIIKNQVLYFISAHKQPDRSFKSWSALFSTSIDAREDKEPTRLTPYGSVDYVSVSHVISVYL